MTPDVVSTMGVSNCPSAIGRVKITVQDGEIVGLEPNQDPTHIESDDAVSVRQAIAALEGTNSGVKVKLLGTPFQVKVWEELQKVPFGSTITYTELARRVGEPQAQRAVANACGANKIAVLVPCHRAMRSDGSLGGYKWGEDLKRQLLIGEGSL